MKVVYFAEAKEELDAAIKYYDGQRTNLGQEFYDEVQSALERIKAMPSAWSLIWRDVRVCQAHRFPYGIVYQVRGNAIAVVAVMHLHGRPGYWKTRIR